MNDITLTIPGEALAVARIPRGRMEDEHRKELALQLYREGIVASFGACRIAGMEKAEFQYILGQRGIAQQYDVEDYRTDKETLAAWHANTTEKR